MATNRRRTTRSSTLRTNTVKVYPTGSATPASVAATETPATEAIDWQTEYAYVHKDLRQLVIISAILFGLLLLGGLLI
jgi:hypothetical protein